MQKSTFFAHFFQKSGTYGIFATKHGLYFVEAAVSQRAIPPVTGTLPQKFTALPLDKTDKSCYTVYILRYTV